MRPIDGDALKITLDTFATIVGFRGVYDRGQVMECIDAAPTVVPDKKEALMPYIGHGKNGPDPMRVRCGACRGPIDCFDAYCKHCGMAVKWDE